MAIIDGHIKCSACGEMKPLDDYASSFVKQGNGRCRPCHRRTSYGKEWAAAASPEELERVRSMTRRYYRANKTKHMARARARRLRVDYGITVADYDAILVSQGGRCACCGTADPGGRGCMHVDHDHVTGAIRGLLCHNCNRAIGLLGDTIEGVRRALDYLERSQPRPAPTMRINLLKGAN